MTRAFKRRRSSGPSVKPNQWPKEAFRMGLTPRNTYLKGTKSGRSDRKPALQSITYKWTNEGTGVTVNTGGAVFLMTSYPRGNSEDQRHTSETLTFKMDIALNICVAQGSLSYINRARNVVWLIYDAQPSGTMPTCSAIFDVGAGFTTIPEVWKVQRELRHRYVVKRRWVFTTETNGTTTAMSHTNNPCNPCASQLYFKRFIAGLGVRTEWKNVATGGIGDISKGCLYMCIAPGNAMPIVCKGNLSMYFKSSGNQ